MMNDKSSNRRNLLNQGMLLGGVLLAKSNVERVAVEEKPNGQPKTQPANETLKTIGNLRTIPGNFLDKEAPDTAVQQILQASIRAANASNMQSYSIIVVRDRTLMKQVCTYQGDSDVQSLQILDINDQSNRSLFFSNGFLDLRLHAASW